MYPNTEHKVEFLTGKDYPHLCPKCQKAIDDIAHLFQTGILEDTDDIEAPIMFVGDHGMFCGVHQCINKP